MEPENLAQVMLALAAATPLAAVSLFVVNRHAAGAAQNEIPARTRRNLWILALAGPVNALAWFALNGWMDRMGPGSAAGMALAALAFAGAGLATGFFSRRGGK